MPFTKEFFIPAFLLITNAFLGLSFYLITEISTSLKETQLEIKSVNAEFQEFRVFVATNYATKDDLKDSVTRIEKKLDKLFNDTYTGK